MKPSITLAQMCHDEISKLQRIENRRILDRYNDAITDGCNDWLKNGGSMFEALRKRIKEV
jgi:hypothetical protein